MLSSSLPSSEDMRLAKILWDYMHVNHVLHKADVIIAMGCEDARVAERAAELFHNGLGQCIVCTGKSSAHTIDMLRRVKYPTEAAYFAALMQAAEVPADRILLENHATNSGDNVQNTKILLSKRECKPTSVIVVVPPYSERRQQATYEAQWPDIALQVTSPRVSFEDYPTAQLDYDYLINALVGRVQRLQVYGKNGYQSAATIPDEVAQVYDALVVHGYTKQMV